MLHERIHRNRIRRHPVLHHNLHHLSRCRHPRPQPPPPGVFHHQLPVAQRPRPSRRAVDNPLLPRRLSRHQLPPLSQPHPERTTRPRRPLHHGKPVLQPLGAVHEPLPDPLALVFEPVPLPHHPRPAARPFLLPRPPPTLQFQPPTPGPTVRLHRHPPAIKPRQQTLRMRPRPESTRPIRKHPVPVPFVLVPNLHPVGQAQSPR